MNVVALTGGGRFCAAQLMALHGFGHRERVDLWAGTSAGGCNALAMAAGMEPAKAVDFYRDFAPVIFAGYGWRGWLRAPFAPKYPDAALNSALRAFFGGRRCRDLLAPAVVTTHDLANGHPARWCSVQFPDVPVWELARMTMAAHTYFAPWRGHADGGLFHNDPSVIAIDTMEQLFGPGTLRGLKVMSIGSGGNHVNRAGRALSPRLKTDWLRLIISDTIDGASVWAQRTAAARLLRVAGGHFSSFEFPDSDMDFDAPNVETIVLRDWSRQIEQCALAMNQFFGA